MHTYYILYVENHLISVQMFQFQSKDRKSRT